MKRMRCETYWKGEEKGKRREKSVVCMCVRSTEYACRYIRTTEMFGSRDPGGRVWRGSGSLGWAEVKWGKRGFWSTPLWLWSAVKSMDFCQAGGLEGAKSLGTCVVKKLGG